MIPRRMAKVKYFLIFLAIVFVFGLVQIATLSLVSLSPNGQKTIKKRYYLDGQNVDKGYLSHVIEAFEYAGIERSRDENNWDILWSHLYPFGKTKKFGYYLKALEETKVINKIPGSGWISSKQALSKIKNYRFMPLAFELPSEYGEFIRYRHANPNKKQKWVIKSGKHRNIKVLEDEQVNSLARTEEKFVQKLVSPPLLINGKKFDIGIYTVVTSAEPLRVYMLQSDWLIRFCKEKYHPFEVERVDGYVVGDDYTPIWEVPDVNDYYQNEMSMKKSLFAYLNTEGFNTEKLEHEMKEAVGQIWEVQQHRIRKSVSEYPKKQGQFFELFRMDFVLDESLNIFLLEVNMSPNLSSETHPENAPLYRAVLRNLFLMMQLFSSFPRSNWESSICSAKAPVNCNDQNNEFCSPCLADSQKDLISQISSEYTNRNFFELVSPWLDTKKRPSKILEETEIANFQRRYFQKQCSIRSEWCQN